MSTRFRHAALVGKFQSGGIRKELESIARFLEAHGMRVSLEQETARQTGITAWPSLDADALGAECDVAIVLGGDGTMLGIARRLARHGTPLVGINQGRLGFLTDIPITRMESTLDAMLAGRFIEQRRTLLDVVVERVNGGRQEALALNDVVVNRGSLGSMIECAVDIDGRFAYAMRADGIIVATPTGSTAYALSAGGPILAPELASLLLVPVAPHALTHRPIAISDECVIAITVVRSRDAGVHCDGQAHYTLAEGDRVTVRRAAFRARFLYPEGHDYFAMLREKLHWSAMPERIAGAGND